MASKRMIDPVGRMIGERIDKVRLEHGDTIRELADYLNLSESFMRDIMKGRRRASPEYLLKIAERYNVSLDYLHGRTDHELMIWDDEHLSTLFRATAGLSKEDLDKVNTIVKVMFDDKEKEHEGSDQDKGQ